ncbi:MAG TPA: hypothetical protein VF240_19360 [Pyrinomonadaceae bacterium]
MKLKHRTGTIVRRRAARALPTLALAAAFLFVGHAAPATAAQAKKPISKDGLLKAIRINGLSTAELVKQIEQRGVSFVVTPAVEQEMTASGARPEVVAAARRNYRAGATPAVAAGGGRGGRTNVPPTAKGRARPAPPRGPDYDDLTDQATLAYDTRDPARAVQLLQQAIQLDPSQPRAYQLLGFTQLYLQDDIASAERNMREAITRGGSAGFRVFHDHAEGSFNQTCAGTLFVTQSNVTFKADNGRDTFEALDSQIKEIKVNKLVGRGPLGGLFGGKGDIGKLFGGKGDLGAFHIKVSKNYNFAPLTQKKKESELIIKLVREFGAIKGD